MADYVFLVWRRSFGAEKRDRTLVSVADSPRAAAQIVKVLGAGVADKLDERDEKEGELELARRLIDGGRYPMHTESDITYKVTRAKITQAEPGSDSSSSGSESE